MKKFNKILVTGVFDNFHAGHQFLLWQGSRICKSMVVLIARDLNVLKLKKKLPENNENQRKKG